MRARSRNASMLSGLTPHGVSGLKYKERAQAEEILDVSPLTG